MLLLVGAVVGALAAGLGSPSSLFGSPTPDVAWTAAPAAVRVVDGGTLRLGERVVRLRGLEAPDRGSACVDRAGRAFDCGAASAEWLAALVAGRPLSCQIRGRDALQRALGACEAAGLDLNGALVAAGYARAGGEGASDLAARGAAARSAGAGLWAGAGTPPDWGGRR